MMWNWFDGMGWWMVISGLLMLAFWGGLIALAVLGIKRLAERGGLGGAVKSDPLDIAKARYARGEISKEEFEQIKKDLSD